MIEETEGQSTYLDETEETTTASRARRLGSKRLSRRDIVKDTVKTMVKLYARQMQLEMAGRESSAKILLDVMKDGDLGDKRLAKKAADMEVARIKKNKARLQPTTSTDTCMKDKTKEYENKRKKDLQCEDNIAGGTRSSSGGLSGQQDSPVPASTSQQAGGQWGNLDERIQEIQRTGRLDGRRAEEDWRRRARSHSRGKYSTRQSRDSNRRRKRDGPSSREEKERRERARRLKRPGVREDQITAKAAEKPSVADDVNPGKLKENNMEDPGTQISGQSVTSIGASSGASNTSMETLGRQEKRAARVGEEKQFSES